MNFKFITTGWNCADVLEQTLASIQMQKNQSWRAHVIDDGSPDPRQAEKIKAWCDKHGDRWMYTIHQENRGAVRNQYEGIRAMDPDPEDVVVFIDLDGDRLAHGRVLDRLAHYYDTGALVTYGSYRPVPDPGGPVPVSPYPPEVVWQNSYRQNTLDQGTRYNHLRTAKWKVLREIPKSYFMFSEDEWIFSPADLIVMMGCLELAGGKYACIDETLLIYNAAQPHPDHTRNPDRNVRGSNYTFALPPLEKLDV